MKKWGTLGAALLILLGAALTGKGIWMGGKAVIAQVLMQKAWNTSIKTGKPTPPWKWMDAYPLAKINIPSLGRSAIVLNTQSGQALAFGPAHMRQTPLPGNSGTAVIAAHKNTHFDFLKDIRTGDIVEIQLPQKPMLRFEIFKAEIVHKDNSGIPLRAPVNAPEYLSLVTCYPFNAVSFGGPMRYVVTAKLLES